MIYMEPAQLGIKPIIDSWLEYRVPNGCSEAQGKMLTDLVNWLMPPILDFIQ